MAVDTRDRRASALQFCSPTILTFPEPDGFLGLSQDRAHVATAYRSLFVTGGPIFVGLGRASEIDAAVTVSVVAPRTYQLGFSSEVDAGQQLSVISANVIATQVYVSNIYIQTSGVASSIATSSVATIIEVSESTTAMN
jgi:hypothetical protein